MFIYWKILKFYKCNHRSGGSESVYERLPTDGSYGDEPVSPTFVEDSALTPSDESEIYDPMFPHQENGEENLIKPSNVKNRRSLQQGKTIEINGFC